MAGCVCISELNFYKLTSSICFVEASLLSTTRVVDDTTCIIHKTADLRNEQVFVNVFDLNCAEKLVCLS